MYVVSNMHMVLKISINMYMDMLVTYILLNIKYSKGCMAFQTRHTDTELTFKTISNLIVVLCQFISSVRYTVYQKIVITSKLTTENTYLNLTVLS